MATRKIIALVRDLLLRSRIEAVAKALGAEVIPAATLELARTRTAEHSREFERCGFSRRTHRARTSRRRAGCAPSGLRIARRFEIARRGAGGWI
jgi:hypothetical protein